MCLHHSREQHYKLKTTRNTRVQDNEVGTSKADEVYAASHCDHTAHVLTQMISIHESTLIKSTESRDMHFNMNTNKTQDLSQRCQEPHMLAWYR
jgi:hypothetical protein